MAGKITKKSITVSIMPTYYCRNKCNYCYLGEQTNQAKIFDLKLLAKQLAQIARFYIIESVELYGGDLSILSENFITEMDDILLEYTENIVYTSSPTPHTSHYKNINISVNHQRPDYVKNLELVTKEHPEYNVITVALDWERHVSARYLLRQYNGCKGYVTFIPYSQSWNNKEYPERFSASAYDEFLLQIIREYYEYRHEYTFKLSNLELIRDAINGKYTPEMENNIFITPNNKFACVSYLRGFEFFREFNTVGEWKKIAEADRENYLQRCAHCEFYKNGCVADHVVPHLDCNGCRQTVDWVRQFAMEDKRWI